jgi:hypothetical protein
MRADPGRDREVLGRCRVDGFGGGPPKVRGGDILAADEADRNVTTDDIIKPPSQLSLLYFLFPFLFSVSSFASMAIRRRTVHALLFILGLFLLGTVVVLSSVSYYLSIPNLAYISEEELNSPLGSPSHNSTHRPERIPKIIHQTWKSETLPDRWKPVSEGCRKLMPD